MLRYAIPHPALAGLWAGFLDKTVPRREPVTTKAGHVVLTITLVVPFADAMVIHEEVTTEHEEIGSRKRTESELQHTISRPGPVVKEEGTDYFIAGQLK